MEATYISIDEWMDKAAGVHVYNGILLRHKKECIWVSSNEVDEPRTYYRKWSKSEREKQISYTNAYIWNLERWSWWIYLQGSYGDADMQNRLVDTEGKKRVGRMKRVAWTVCITTCKTESWWEFAVWLMELRPGLYENLEGWDGLCRWLSW